MAEDTKAPAAPAPAQTPAPAPTPAPAQSGSASGTTSTDGGAKTPAPTSPVPKDDVADTRGAAEAARSGRPIQRGSNLITNPAPVTDPDAPVVEKLPEGVPQSTIDEMEAGRKALERNKPVNTKLEQARANQTRADLNKA